MSPNIFDAIFEELSRPPNYRSRWNRWFKEVGSCIFAAIVLPVSIWYSCAKGIIEETINLFCSREGY